MKNLTLKFISDTAQAEKNVDRYYAKVAKGPNVPSSVNKNAQNIAQPGNMQNILKQTSNLNTLTAGLIPNLGGVGGALAGLTPQATLAAAALGAAAFAMNKTMEAGMAAEDAITKMTVLFGGDKLKALQTYKEAINFANVTPFDPADVVPAAVIAGQYGADAFKKGFAGMNAKKDVMMLIGDMASFSGQTMEEAATALFRGDLALLDKYGKAGRDAYENALTKGKLGSEAFRTAFVKNMGEVTLWEGMAEKRSKTISGMWSTIVGNFNTAFLYLSGAAEGDDVLTFWGQLRSIVGDITSGSDSILSEMKPILLELGASMGAMLKGLWDTGKAVFTLMGPQLFIIWSVVKGYFSYIFALTTRVFQVVGAIARAVTFVARTVLGWIKGSEFIMGTVAKFAGWIDNVTLKIQMILVFLGLWWDGFWENVSKGFENLPNLIAEAFTKAQEKIKDIPIVGLFVNNANPMAGNTPGQPGISLAESLTGRTNPVNPPGTSSATTTTNNSESRVSTTNVTQNINVQSPTAATRVIQEQKDLSGRPK